jgi:hypothetical protein
MFEEAAAEKVNTIFTLVYGKGIDDGFTKDIIKRVESHHGRLCFVGLCCDRRILLNRVGRKSRKKVGKLTSKAHLSLMFRRFDMASEFLFVKRLSIDTGEISSLDTARQIARWHKLGKEKEEIFQFPSGTRSNYL